MLFVRFDEPRRRLRLRTRPLFLPYLFVAGACVPLLLLLHMEWTGATPPEIWPVWLVLPGLLVPFVLWLYNDSWSTLELPAAGRDESAVVWPGLLERTLRPAARQITGVWVFRWGYRSPKGSGSFLQIAVGLPDQREPLWVIGTDSASPDDPRLEVIAGHLEALGYTVHRQNPRAAQPASAASPPSTTK